MPNPMNRPRLMTMRVVAAALSFQLALPTPAAAQAPRGIQAFIKRANAQCDLVGYHEVYKGQLHGSSQPVTVAVYTIEGCGGGGNVSASSFGIFSEASGVVQEWVPSPALEGQVRAVTVADDRVRVQWMSWKASDPHCCPTLSHVTSYVLSGHQAVAAR